MATNHKLSDIEHRRFIDIFISFGLDSKRLDVDAEASKLFLEFNGVWGELGHEEEWGLPKEVHLKKNLFVFMGRSVEFYTRSKDFTLKRVGKGAIYTFKDDTTTVEKCPKNIITFQFAPVSSYSPMELAKDIIFIENFGTRIAKIFGLRLFKALQIVKSGKKIMFNVRYNTMEYHYSLKERIELYEKNRSLDKFIFRDDLKKVIRDKSNFGKNIKLYDEAQKMFNKAIS